MSSRTILGPLAALLFFSFTAAAAGCAAPADEDVDQTEDALTTYGDLFSTLDDHDIDRWFSVRKALKDGFDRICGDTICGGDYSNLSTVRIACSSTSVARKMKDCAWVLGGSIEYVDGRTGKLTSDARVFTCKIPVAGTAKRMLDALEPAGQDALHTPIPGTGKSFYDGLVECFSGVVGGPPPPEPAKTFYAELGEWSWEHADGLAWMQTTRNLAEGFDQICGDTFCEGEYPDITPLRFACSVNLNTKRVSRCSWTFAAADLQVDRRGQLAATTTTKRCNIEIGATASDLADALSGPDPLNATLPGKTTSIYDTLSRCL
ncbi:MAG: hypothetical protein KF782_29250 [Labilithrix sp.]|nr:hypothetical protein [Labilithrix sp.]